VKLLGNVTDGRCPATPSYIPCKAFSVKGVVRKKGKFFLFHQAATPARNATNLELQVDTKPTAGKVSYAPSFPVVKSLVDKATGAACRFFSLRLRVIMRAEESPKTPRTIA
jgi:hypothetical protein